MKKHIINSKNFKNNIMKFDFAVATDITEFAKSRMPEMYGHYEKIYITPDTNDYHILRIIKGYGENYERNENKVILEHQLISKSKTEKINTLENLKKILQKDDGGNYDYRVKNSVEECITIVDGGFGIN